MAVRWIDKQVNGVIVYSGFSNHESDLHIQQKWKEKKHIEMDAY